MKILLIRFSSLGDIVLTEPVIRNIKISYPKSEIHYLTKPVFAQVVKRFENVDKIWFWKDKRKLIKSLRSEKFDIVIDLHQKLNSFIVKKSINGKKTITYEKKHFLRKMIINKMTSQKIDSVVNLYLDSLKKINIKYKKIAPKIIAENSLKNIEIFDSYGIPRNRSLIAIFPGATHKTKQYPIDCLATFLDNVPSAWLCHFVIMGNHSEKELATRILAKTKNNITDLTGVFNIEQLIDFMGEMDGFITNDSGPMHLAAALQKPQIAIYGATHPKLGFRPLNKKAVILKSEIKCQPCSLHGSKQCPKKHFSCMRSISSEQLFQTFKEMLETDIWGF